jgi:hypothetical protein
MALRTPPHACSHGQRAVTAAFRICLRPATDRPKMSLWPGQWRRR